MSFSASSFVKRSFFVLKQYMHFSRNSFRLHIVMVQEADVMSIRLVIDGNAVYEIDEDCLNNRQKKMGSGPMVRKQETQKKRRRNEEK